MTGVYVRINKLLEYVNSDYNSNFDLWAALAHPDNKVINLKHMNDIKLSVDEAKKALVYTGTHDIFSDKKKFVTYEYPMSEELAEKVYKAIQTVALTKMEPDYKAEEKRLRTIKMKKFLNKKIFGQSFDFITEE